MKKIFTITALVGVVSVFGCSSKSAQNQNQNQSENGAEEKAFTVSTITLAPETLEDYIEFGGSVRAANTVEVFPTVSGKISRILVEAGDKVKRNQIIAQVDASKPGVEFTESPIRASAAGTVTVLPVSNGSYVTTSTAVAEISSTDNLEIITNVAERFVPSIKRSQNAEISFKSYPDETFSGSVTKISPVLDPATRAMQVTFKLADSKGFVKSGMFAHVKLITKTKENALCIPEKAIVYASGKPTVFTVSDSDGNAAVHRVQVETGIFVDGKVEITSGLSSGEEIVVKGQNMISEGQRVRR